MFVLRLADSYKLDKERLAEIGKPEVLANLQELLKQQTVSPNTFTTCLHILVSWFIASTIYENKDIMDTVLFTVILNSF